MERSPMNTGDDSARNVSLLLSIIHQSIPCGLGIQPNSCHYKYVRMNRQARWFQMDIGRRKRKRETWGGYIYGTPFRDLGMDNKLSKRWKIVASFGNAVHARSITTIGHQSHSILFPFWVYWIKEGPSKETPKISGTGSTGKADTFVSQQVPICTQNVTILTRSLSFL